AGAGAFLCAAARAIPRARFAGADLDPEALRIARGALALCGAVGPTLVRADSLRTDLAPADLLVSNPPYGHVGDAKERLFLLRRPSTRTRARAPRVLRGPQRLADAPEAELRAAAARGWQIYRSEAERRLCAEMEDAAVPLGRAGTVGYGLRTGDNTRFVARRASAAGEIALVGGEDVVPFALRLRPKALCAPTGELRALAARQLGQPRICIQRIRTNSRVPH